MVFSCTMALADISKDAAASPEIVEYLELRGLKTAATLALLSKDEEGLEKTLISPLMQGWTRPDGSTLTVKETDKPIARAVLLHMWLLCRQQWSAAQAAMQPTPAAPPVQQSTTSSSSTSEDKIPKSLPPGKWTALIQEYQTKQAILARVIHENESSKMFTPVLLGEIISPRTFTATENPNPLAKKEKNTTKLSFVGDQLTAEKDEPWTPRCFILCKMGTEQSVHAFFDWMVRLVRSRPNKTDQLAQFWLSTSWKLALDMRAGRTFSEATALLMKDFDAFTECMSREPTHIKKTPSMTNKTEQKGQGKGNTKSGKATRPSPYSRPSRPWNSYQPERQDRAASTWQGNQRPDDNSWQRDSWAPHWKGSESTAYCGFANQIKMKLPHTRIGHLTENVVMEKGKADFFAERLDCNTVAADAADFGLVNRPRLWWTRVDWSRQRLSPVTGKQLKWSKMQKFHRLHQDGLQRG
eukprot:s2661_g11.t1